MVSIPVIEQKLWLVIELAVTKNHWCSDTKVGVVGKRWCHHAYSLLATLLPNGEDLTLPILRHCVPAPHFGGSRTGLSPEKKSRAVFWPQPKPHPFTIIE